MGRWYGDKTYEFNKRYNKIGDEMNKVLLLGRIGSEIETREFNGSNVSNFSLATSKKFKKKDGSTEEKTSWHNVTVWGGLNKVLEYVEKGCRVYVEGEVDYQQYDKDGVTKYVTKINASNIQIIDFKKSEQSEIPV